MEKGKVAIMLGIIACSYAWDCIKAASEDILFPTVIATKCGNVSSHFGIRLFSAVSEGL